MSSFDEISYVLPTATTDIEHRFATGRFYKVVNTPKKNPVMPSVHHFHNAPAHKAILGFAEVLKAVFYYAHNYALPIPVYIPANNVRRNGTNTCYDMAMTDWS
ncbi:MAG: hypothetical protein ACLTSL_00315 [Odoribacter splanchnicus]